MPVPDSSTQKSYPASSESDSHRHGADFFLQVEGPHIARRCRCGKWLGWVKRTSENLAACENEATPRAEPTQSPLTLVEPKRYQPVGEQVRPSFVPQVDTESAGLADSVCRAELSELKKTVEKIDRQLLLFTKIFAGVAQQGHGR